MKRNRKLSSQRKRKTHNLFSYVNDKYKFKQKIDQSCLAPIFCQGVEKTTNK
jgi:hypothetical protein